MLVRRALQLALGALAAMVVFSLLWNIGLGVDEPTLGTIITSYTAWGRWAELATVLLFAALLVVAPLLPGPRRAAHVIVSGTVIAMVGDLIDLSRFPRVDVVDLVRVNAIPTDLVAGRGFQFSMQAAPTYVWVAGILLVGVGMFILAVDAEDRTWSRASLTLGIALSVVALTDINVETATVSWIASWISMGLLFNWLLVTLRVTGQPDGLTYQSNPAVSGNTPIDENLNRTPRCRSLAVSDTGGSAPELLLWALGPLCRVGSVRLQDGCCLAGACSPSLWRRFQLWHRSGIQVLCDILS